MLWTDAATCLAMALFLLLLAQPLAPLFGLPAVLLETAGALLVSIGGFIAWAARSAALRAGAGLTIVGNAAWVAASCALFLPGATDLTPAGYAFVALQALVVAALAVLEYIGLSRL